MVSDSAATVLVVEDDPGIAELEKERLSDAGYRIVLAGSADEAVGCLRRGGVDLILLDYRLPGGVNGLDFYTRVKAAGFDLPVILVTGFGNEATIIQALRVGVRDFVTKSVEYLDYLPEAVGRVLRQVRTELRLAESEARLASVIGSAKDAIIATGPDQRITLFNPAAEQMFRCSAAQALGEPLTRFMPNELIPPPGREDGDPGQPVETLSHRIRAGTRGVRTDGEEFPLEASISRTEVGGERFHTIVVRDVTERKRAEQAARDAARERDALLARLQLHIERMPLAYVLFDAEFRVTDWNPTAERIFGYTRAEVLGMGPPFEKILPPTEWPQAEEILRRVRAGDMAAHSVSKNRTKDWRIVTCEWFNTPLLDADGRFAGLLCLAQDVTGRKLLEEQFRQAQKMEAVGQLAGGVAHDFNNLLTVINGFSELLLEAAAPDDPGRELLEEIRKAGERSAGLTRQLLAFSRKQVLAPRVLDLNAVVTDVERMLRRVIGEDVRLAIELEPHLGAVRADPGQIEQVLLNLAVNARDAMPTGGTLTVATRNVAPGDGPPGAPQGPAVAVSVTDTGCGMAEEVKARIFEPFFTTKGPGEGTGLGLAVVHGVVAQSGGHVEVETAPGRGTTFRFYLPRAADAPAPALGRPVTRTAPRGTETLLLVEDDAAVRALTGHVLRGGGYRVLEAAEGGEALRVAAGHGGRIDLLVTDVVLPGLGGWEVAERLRAAHPGLQVLFLSGYTDDAVVRHGVAADRVNFLQKPFTPAALSLKVREVLDGSDSAAAGEPDGEVSRIRPEV